MKIYKKITGVIFLVLFTYAGWVLNKDKLKSGLAIIGLIFMYALSAFCYMGGI